MSVGTGFAAYYPNTLRTNAHVMLVLREEGYVHIPVGDLDFGIRVDEVWTLIDLIETEVEPTAGSRRAYPRGLERAVIMLSEQSCYHGSTIYTRLKH